MSRYQNTINTNISWIPQIPNHWNLMKVNALFQERKCKVSDKVFSPLSVTKKGILPQLEHAAKTNNGDNRKFVKAGDFVINSRSDRKSSCGVSQLDGSVSLINIVLTPREELNGKYIHYLLRNYRFSEEYYKNGRGIVADLWTTRYSEMKSILIPVPPRTEQDQIVRFLDWKVSEINKLITLKRKKIKELKSLKLCHITEVVTRGLNYKIKNKSSASKWIGTVPQHWDIVSIRRAYTVILGKMLSPDKTTKSDRLEEYICAKDVHFDGVSLCDLKKMWFSYNEREQYRVFDGDLMVVEGGAGAGNAAVVMNINEKRVYVQNSVHIIRAKDGKAINEYLYFWLFSLVKRGYMESVCSVATIPHYTKDKVLATIMPLPPLLEQKKIVTYLRDYSAKIDALILNIESSIKDMKELQSSLISDVVTGKIDVRNVEIPEYEHIDDMVDDGDGEENEEELADAEETEA